MLTHYRSCNSNLQGKPIKQDDGLQKLSKNHLDGVIGVGNKCDKKAEDHVDEERHKGVEVDSAEDPHQTALLIHVLEGGKHVVSVDQREQTL